MAKAVGGDPSKVRIISLVAGSIRVLMALDEGKCGDGRGALDVANDLQQLAADHGVPVGTLVSPTVNLAPTVQIAAPVRRSAKLSNMPIGRGLSEANKAEDDSKQEAFTEEIARLSALAEDRRCELLDTHARIVSLEEELGAQKKHAQKATAGMYVEMDRMQTLIDSDQVEMNEMLAKLKEQGKQPKEL